MFGRKKIKLLEGRLEQYMKIADSCENEVTRLRRENEIIQARCTEYALQLTQLTRENESLKAQRNVYIDCVEDIQTCLAERSRVTKELQESVTQDGIEQSEEEHADEVKNNAQKSEGMHCANEACPGVMDQGNCTHCGEPFFEEVDTGLRGTDDSLKIVRMSQKVGIHDNIYPTG